MAPRTTVLYLIPNLGLAGAERMVVHLATGLDRRRFRVVLASLFNAGDAELLSELDAAGVEIHLLDKRLGFDARMISALHRLLRDIRPDVVHTHRYVLAYLVPLLVAPRTWKVIHTVHNLADREVGPVGRLAYRIGFARGVEPVSIAHEVSESVRRVYGLAEVPLIPNGIPVSAFRERGLGEAWRQVEGFEASDIVFVNIGRLSDQKNHRLLLSAFSQVQAQIPRARLLIVGEGELRRPLEQAAEGLGISRFVRFLGRRTDVKEILCAADIFVMSSDYEGNPLSVMEAMAAGLPVVSTAVGGVPELVSHLRTGFLVPPSQVNELSRACTTLASDEGLRIEYGAAARERASDRFDVSQMIRAYEEMYVIS